MCTTHLVVCSVCTVCTSWDCAPLPFCSHSEKSTIMKWKLAQLWFFLLSWPCLNSLCSSHSMLLLNQQLRTGGSSMAVYVVVLDIGAFGMLWFMNATKSGFAAHWFSHDLIPESVNSAYHYGRSIPQRNFVVQMILTSFTQCAPLLL